MPPQKLGLPKTDDIDGTWKFIEEGISQIMETLEMGMSFQRCMELYTIIYDFCTQSKMQRFGESSVHAGGKGAHLMGADLYAKLKNYLSNHLERITSGADNLKDEDLLRYYTEKWSRFTVGAGFVHHIFRYLNRHWVKREIDEGKADIHDVYTLGLVLWRSIVFDHVQIELISAVLNLIKKQRNGEAIETTLIKKVVDSYISLGINNSDASKPSLNVYRQYFSKPFLEATQVYYKAESEKFVLENSISDYMKKAEARLHEEESRVEMYLDHTSYQPLMLTCDQTLISAHAELMQEEFLMLLENDRYSDMTRMYKLLARIPEGLAPLRVKFEAHIRKSGIAAVDNCSNSTEDDNINAKDYVEALLSVHSMYNNLVATAFQGDPEFVKSLDNACREFVNRNKVCKSSSSRSPELLAKHCDSLLKRSKNTEEADLEASLHSVMTVFKYIEDKDVFQKFYTKQLARRLVNDSSVSDDAESSMINKLKEACGFEYTNKLQRMFQDMSVSKDVSDQYKARYDSADTSSDLDLGMLVLGGAFWPLQPPQHGFNIPAELLKTYNRFQSFYQSKHSGRKLNWLWHLCKGEMKVNFTRGAKYTFQVSTYQMAILLAYNEATTRTYEELEAITGLTSKEQLDGALNILLKAKVLLLEGTMGHMGSKYNLNLDFKSKKLKLNLNMPIKSEQKQESEDTHKTIEEDRKLLTQSAIVRIMKARKVLKHTPLVQETISQIKSRFSPKVSDIKKCIDILIEKEYLERSDKDEYTYLA